VHSRLSSVLRLRTHLAVCCLMYGSSVRYVKFALNNDELSVADLTGFTSAFKVCVLIYI